MKQTMLTLLILMSLLLASCATGGEWPGPKEAAERVDQEMIIANEAESTQWPTHGLDYAETRHSKLTQITPENVGELGLAWSHELHSRRGVEATPIVVDGIMYTTASWSVVHALDARTGEELWVYDPEVPGDYAYKGCCDVVNRGVAVHQGKVYVGTYDGYLVALNGKTGEIEWRVDTIENREMSYTITGAPRIYNGKVMIGNGGAEYGVRGYITAYNANSGTELWRWYSVPGDPNEPFEEPSQEMAAQTWDPAGEWWVAGGGGATVAPGTATYAVRQEATISSWPRWWRSIQIQANMSVTIRKHQAIAGIIRPPNISFWPI